MFGVGICPPNCMTERGCPKGTPDKQRTLNEANRTCFEHYKECKAVGQFPNDPVVRRNAAVIRDVEERYEQIRKTQQHNDLVQLMLIKGGLE